MIDNYGDSLQDEDIVDDYLNAHSSGQKNMGGGFKLIGDDEDFQEEELPDLPRKNTQTKKSGFGQAGSVSIPKKQPLPSMKGLNSASVSKNKPLTIQNQLSPPSSKKRSNSKPPTQGFSLMKDDDSAGDDLDKKTREDKNQASDDYSEYNDDDDYEDDFDEDEEEQFRATAAEFQNKLKELNQINNGNSDKPGAKRQDSRLKSQGRDLKGNDLAAIDDEYGNDEEQDLDEFYQKAMSGAKGAKVKSGKASSRPPLHKPAAGGTTTLQSTRTNQITSRNSANNARSVGARGPQGGQQRTQGDLNNNQFQSPSMIKSLPGRAGKSPNKRQQDNNPFKFIEQALTEAKGKIEKMKATPQVLESLPDNDKKKKFLKAENKLLRENLKRMSDNVNVLIEKMNQESMRKKKAANQVIVAGGAQGQNDSGQFEDGGEVAIDDQGRPIQRNAAGGRGGGAGGAGGQGGGPGGAGGAGGRGAAGRSTSPGIAKSVTSGYRGGTLADRESQNTDKAIVNLMKEHQKLKRRLDVVQQPDFLLNLKRDLKTTEEEIKQQEKLKRQLKVDQLKREKKLDSIMEQSEPDVMKQVQDTTQRLSYLTEKLAKIEEENQKAEALRNTQLDQLEELRTRLSKLNTIAEHYGVSIEKSKHNIQEHKKLTEQLDHLNKQKRILTQAIDTQTKKQEVLTAEKKRDLEQLQARKIEILKKYKERVNELREKGLQIRDLIERAKAEADIGLHDILAKWEQANDRILEKYPEGAEMDFSMLDDQNNTADDGGDGKKRKARLGTYHRDDEMQTYLQEIRVKQEELDQKLKDSETRNRVKLEQAEADLKTVEDKVKKDKLRETRQSQQQNSIKSKKTKVQDLEDAQRNKEEVARLKAELERERQRKQEYESQMKEQHERQLQDLQKDKHQTEERLKNQMKQKEIEAYHKQEQLMEEAASAKAKIQEEAKLRKRAQEEDKQRKADEKKDNSAIYEGGQQSTIINTSQDEMMANNSVASIAQVEQEKVVEDPIAKVMKDHEIIEEDPVREQIEESIPKEEEEVFKPQPSQPAKSTLGSKPNFFAKKPALGASPRKAGPTSPQKAPLSFLERQKLAQAQKSGGSGIVYPGGQAQAAPTSSQPIIKPVASTSSIVYPQAQPMLGPGSSSTTSLIKPVETAPVTQPVESVAMKPVEPVSMQPGTTTTAAKPDVGYTPSMMGSSGASRRPRARPGVTETANPAPISRAPAADPFAKYDAYNPAANAKSPSKEAAPVQQPKPMSLDDILKNSALGSNKPASFMDQVKNDPKPSQAPAPLASRPRPQMKMSQPQTKPLSTNQEAKPKFKPLVASLDELEDLS